MRSRFSWTLLFLLGGCGTERPLRPGGAEFDQWPSGGGGPFGQYYSRLDRINQQNAGSLGFAWEYTARSTRGRVQHGMQGTALVVDGTMYVSGPWSVVYALDAKTGRER